MDRTTSKSIQLSDASTIICTIHGVLRQTKKACHVGVSAILSQKTKETNEEKVLAYASRDFIDVEKRYCQTEKEALAIIWRGEHFYLYLYGNVHHKHHKPLEVIDGNRKSKLSARIERWILHLQPYSFKVVYRPGKHNPYS